MWCDLVSVKAWVRVLMLVVRLVSFGLVGSGMFVS